MSDLDDIHRLLTEIRDNQRTALERQERQLAIAEQQLERSRAQVEESIDLQRQAIDRVRRISRIAVPGLIFCFALIIYLIVRYL